MKPWRRDDGFTLPELLITITIMGIVMVPLTISMLLGIATTAQGTQELSDSSDNQLLASYFINDVQSAEAVYASGAGCGSGTSFLRLTWTEPKSGDSVVVVYSTTATSVLRTKCVNGGAGNDVEVVRSLSGTPQVTCIDSSGSAPCSDNVSTRKPLSVKLDVTAMGGQRFDTSYSISLAAARRVNA